MMVDLIFSFIQSFNIIFYLFLDDIIILSYPESRNMDENFEEEQFEGMT
jgi:hypothetical protein